MFKISPISKNHHWQYWKPTGALELQASNQNMFIVLFCIVKKEMNPQHCKRKNSLYILNVRLMMLTTHKIIGLFIIEPYFAHINLKQHQYSGLFL